MSDESDAKAYVELVEKTLELKIIINRIRKSAECYDKEIQNAAEVLVYEHEHYVKAIDENLLKYFRDSDGSKNELIILNLKKGILKRALDELEKGKYNKRVTDKEYKEFIKRRKTSHS